MIEPLRGQAWFVDIPRVGEKPVVIVSNNARNRALQTVLAVRVTTAPKPAMRTIIELSGEDPLVGRAMCDDILMIPKSRLKRRAGALARPSMAKIARGLKAALALD